MYASIHSNLVLDLDISLEIRYYLLHKYQNRSVANIPDPVTLNLGFIISMRVSGSQTSLCDNA